MAHQGKVLVIADQSETRRQICGRLASEGHAVLAESTDRFNITDEPFRPDAVVVELPLLQAEQLLTTILTPPAPPTIVLVPAGAPTKLKVRALMAGATDVVAGPYDAEEIALRVTLLLRRTMHVDALTVGDIVIDEAGHVAHRNGQLLELTATEFRLLVTLARNVGVVLSKRQLLAAVWGFDDYDVNLVEVHTSALRRKLEASGPRVIQTVRALGYVMRAPVRVDLANRWSA